MADIYDKHKNNPVLAPVITGVKFASYLTIHGWTNVDYPHVYTSQRQAVDVEVWVEENLGEFWRMGRTYYFKEEADASMFLLRWA